MINILEGGKTLFSVDDVFKIPEEGDMFILEGSKYEVIKIEHLFNKEEEKDINIYTSLV
jgi:hypothetical protein